MSILAAEPVHAANRVRPQIASGRGIYLYDEEGRRYLDGCSGAVVANIGHGVTEVNAAIAAQAEQIAFVYRTQFDNAPAVRLQRRLASLTPGDLDAVTLVNSGSEANEAAIRLAVQYWRAVGQPGKTRILARRTSYHGMTMGALSLSGHPHRREGLESLLIDVPRVVSPYACPPGQGREWAADWDRMIREVGADQVAAVIVEPVVGAAGGAIPSPPGYLLELRTICDRHGVLLIADEVMTGLGRTGVWFASAVDGVVPDIVTVGKGMSAGYAPMAAMITRVGLDRTVRATGTDRVFGHTYSGNPLGAAACLAVLDYLEDHDLLLRAREAGSILREGLLSLAQRHPAISDVRGQGLLLGMELAGVDVGPHAAQRLTDLAFDCGLLLYPAGTDESPDAVIIAPPLVIEDGQLDELLGLLDESLTLLEQ
ncbi:MULTISPECIES: aminotransferase class III-fold pyridoxal phosphate-dependent enzyme [unclassified Frankia]|uniref:aminotransferase class III-fold pyridoxal phosphate-dependent enzyme n=1 Tax=unclassified Frankia TaxID=2632575 RepID=UPI0020245D91